jgi:purine-binding chemotaxis protein CheW
MRELVRLDPGSLVAELEEAARRVVLFRACGEWYALPLERVREIQPLDRVIRIPTAPPEVRGVLNLRGRALTLFDLGWCLGIPSGPEPDTHMIVLDLGDPDLRVAIGAQRIGQVRRLPDSAVEPPPPRDDRPGGLEGVFDADGQVIGLLDLGRVFARFASEWGISLEARSVAETQPT